MLGDCSALSSKSDVFKTVFILLYGWYITISILDLNVRKEIDGYRPFS